MKVLTLVAAIVLVLIGLAKFVSASPMLDAAATLFTGLAFLGLVAEEKKQK